MSEAKDFRIEILHQSWICGDEGATVDPCSHGQLRVLIGGINVAELIPDCGISESALALLRTLDSDHTESSPVAERLVFHGCGLILMQGCPIGIDWDVVHRPGMRVSLSRVRVHPTTSTSKVVIFPDLSVEFDEAAYRKTVTTFAKQAKSFFSEIDKEFDDQFDRKQYEDFWVEFDRLLKKYS